MKKCINNIYIILPSKSGISDAVLSRAGAPEFRVRGIEKLLLEGRLEGGFEGR